MKIKIIVVEDNVSLNRSIVNVLNKEGYSVFGVTNLEDAKKTFNQEKPHIILLDIMLGDGYGYNLIKLINNKHDCRILILSALDDKDTKSICYENGADDYITKPFDLYELIFKLNAIKKRILMNLKICQIGDITFNTQTNELFGRNKHIIIQPSQIKLLKLLYDQYLENRYVDKYDVFDHTCEEINDTGRLQTLVARLRKNLDYVGSQKIDIETIYGKGYKLIVI